MNPLGYEVPENPHEYWVFGHSAFLKILFATLLQQVGRKKRFRAGVIVPSGYEVPQ